MQGLYIAGKFKRFGLSNFNVEELQEAYDLVSSKGYVLPTVFQGNYSLIARHVEENLFPLLRKLGISFWVYSVLREGTTHIAYKPAFCRRKQSSIINPFMNHNRFEAYR